MVKLTFCLHRLPHLSRAQFQEYWRETHGPLVRARAGVLDIRRYVQLHTLNSEAGAATNDALRASRNAPQDYDGVAELWWESVESLAAATSTVEGAIAARELLEDEGKFIDLARSPLFVAQEHEVVGPASR